VATKECALKTKNGLRRDIQVLIVVGKQKLQIWTRPIVYLEIDDECRQAFNATGKVGGHAEIQCPVSNQGIAKFTAKLPTIKREA
jgi:hypothetical protein